MSDSNGSNGHSKHGVDMGLHEEIEKPCCKRFEFDRWCRLPDAHEGPCDDGGLVYGPKESPWHQKTRGQSVPCSKVIGDDALCQWPRGHGGPCKK